MSASEGRSGWKRAFARCWRDTSAALTAPTPEPAPEREPPHQDARAQNSPAPTPPPEPRAPEPAAGPTKVRVQVKNGWADVYVDGRNVGQTPLTLDVAPGAHTIRVHNPQTGYESTQSVDVAAGEMKKIAL